MPVRTLNHYSIRTADMEASKRFYTEVLGLVVGPRPPFDFPGYWLFSGLPRDGDVGVVHILGVDAAGSPGLVDYLGPRGDATDTGRLDHVAFSAVGLADMLRRLDARGIAYTQRTIPELGVHQLFFADPDGVTLEVNFPAREPAVAQQGSPAAARIPREVAA